MMRTAIISVIASFVLVGAWTVITGKSRSE